MLSTRMIELKKEKPIPVWILFAITIAVFIADLNVQLGIVVWVFYILPLVLSIAALKVRTPIILSLTSILFIILAFIFSPEGHLPIRIVIFNRVLGSLTMIGVALICKQVIESKLATLRDQWLRSGVNELADLTRGEASLQQMADKSLSFLCRYLNADVAVLYVLNDAGGLKRFRTYGLSLRDSHLPEEVSFEDGKIGQAAKEKRILSFSNLPDQYLRVSSALGVMPIESNLIAPMMADKETMGVIELGFKAPLEGDESELVHLVSEHIGIAIKTAQSRLRLEELLEETQRQSEELQIQQEELQVTNEELQEQTRSLKESQVKLESQQSELEETNQQLEEQAQILEKQKEELTTRNDELNLTRQELEKRARELAEASQYKSEFLANMSHELRTPLNSTLILAKLLADNKEGNLNEEQIKFAQTIYSAGNDLLSLINDILDLSKVEAGKLEIHPAEFSIEKMVIDLKLLAEAVARDKNLTFEVEIDQSAPKVIVNDKLRLEQILKNLISNALKFTEHGFVKLKVMGTDQGICFQVIDTGIGIKPSQHNTIFEAFRQADGTTNRKYGGTGLGLSISRDLAHMLGGEIKLQSAEGKGSVFSLHLPLQFAPNALKAPVKTYSKPEEETHSAMKPKNEFSILDDRENLKSEDHAILIIEDESVFAKILYDLCKEAGFKCLVAPTAEDGRNLAEEYLPVAILLDVVLPDQSGISLLDQIKASPSLRHIPVTMVSGKDYTQTALNMGAMSYVLKPVKKEELQRLFAQIRHSLENHNRKVLIIEDDKVQADSISALLKQPDVELTQAHDATSALRFLKKLTFDCVVMDLTLPDMSGFELLKTLVMELPAPLPPIIIYTGRSLNRDEEKSLLEYSKSIVLKGARSPERLLDEVTLFLHKAPSKLSLSQRKMLQDARSRDKLFEERKILIVDDDVRNIFALSSALEKKGARIEIARNGKEAIEKLETTDQIELVLMDIMMPEMDGYEAMRRIRKMPKFARLPIIAVTAKAMRDDHEKCLEAGANDYLSKPVNIEKLLSLIRVWIAPLGNI